MMKSLLSLVATLFFVANADASPVDQFVCKMHITDATNRNEILSTTSKFSGIRREILKDEQGNPIPQHIKRYQTIENPIVVDFKHKKENYTVAYNLEYEFITRTDSSGKIEARTSTCSSFSVSQCEGTGCSAYQIACMGSHTTDPFDPIYGWAQTGVFNGEPMFNPKELGSISGESRDARGKTILNIEVNCRFMNTVF